LKTARLAPRRAVVLEEGTRTRGPSALANPSEPGDRPALTFTPDVSHELKEYGYLSPPPPPPRKRPHGNPPPALGFPMSWRSSTLRVGSSRGHPALFRLEANISISNYWQYWTVSAVSDMSCSRFLRRDGDVVSWRGDFCSVLRCPRRQPTRR